MAFTLPNLRFHFVLVFDSPLLMFCSGNSTSTRRAVNPVIKILAFWPVVSSFD
jgi:hypothetical protein